MTIVTLAEERAEKLFEQFEQFHNDGDGYLTRRQSDPMPGTVIQNRNFGVRPDRLTCSFQ
ncbi:hypothetical protein ACWEPL_21525 [Nonomuraea sp. NPDC004186]